jgi:hypothetical protein
VTAGSTPQAAASPRGGPPPAHVDGRPVIGRSAGGRVRGRDQWKESPQAQEPEAFGLSIVKPCFSMVSTKSMEAPPR